MVLSPDHWKSIAALPASPAQESRGERQVSRLPQAVLLVIACCGLAGCAPLAERAALVIANLKFPVLLNVQSAPNQPLSAAERRQLDEFAARIDPKRHNVVLPKDAQEQSGFDTMTDLLEEHTNAIVIVAISGGGTRAATLASQTMSLLEQEYDRVRRDREWTKPLFSVIDAYSTVSGGSLYAYQLAMVNEALERGAIRDRQSQQHDQPADAARRSLNAILGPPAIEDEPDCNRDLREHLFKRIAAAPRTRELTKHIGARTGWAYLSPLRALLPFARTAHTNETFTDRLAESLDQTQCHLASTMIPGACWPKSLMLGALPGTPRFFFNATALEMGSGLVLTQRKIQLPVERLKLTSARLDAPALNQWWARCRELHGRPLCNSLTLEDINSSPERFPLAYAAAASAAYPVGFAPVELQRYQFNESTPNRTPFPAQEAIHLVDGGVNDNSGLTTAADLIDYLLTADLEQHIQRVVVIAINADFPGEDPAVSSRLTPEKNPWSPGSWFRASPPIGSLQLNAQSLDEIHATNKRRVEREAGERLRSFNRWLKEDRCGGLDYFPVHLSQLLTSDVHPIASEDLELPSRIQSIATDLVLSDDDEAAIQQAVATIVHADQGDDSWNVGPDSCRGGSDVSGPSTTRYFVRDLGTALGYTLVRTQSADWNMPVQDPQAASNRHLGKCGDLILATTAKNWKDNTPVNCRYWKNWRD